MRASLALVILTKNQYELAKKIILQCQDFFDHIYILDDNSSDEILSLANENIAVFQHNLSHSFADHRNWILQKVNEDWSFFLDADEMPTKSLLKEIREAIIKPQCYAFQVQRLDSYQGKTLHFGEVGNIWLTRLGKTKEGRWQRAVHEEWIFTHESLGRLNGKLIHHPHKDITSFLAKLNAYAKMEQPERNGRRTRIILLEMLTFPPAKFIQNFFLRQGFRDGRAGLVYALLMSYYSLIKRVFWYEDTTK